MTCRIAMRIVNDIRYDRYFVLAQSSTIFKKAAFLVLLAII